MTATAAKQCPASMCPLIAPDGSPWTGTYGGPCPGHDGLDSGGCPPGASGVSPGDQENQGSPRRLPGCPWWSMTCEGNGIQGLVDEAAALGGRPAMPVLGPNQPRRHEIGAARAYACPKASLCRWQEQAELAGRPLCPPRDALARGIDPRVCLF